VIDQVSHPKSGTQIVNFKATSAHNFALKSSNQIQETDKISALIAYKNILRLITFLIMSCAFKIVLRSTIWDMLSLTNCTPLTADMLSLTNCTLLTADMLSLTNCTPLTADMTASINKETFPY
jgi:hypothetical protein